jgi:hypothetical protein
VDRFFLGPAERALLQALNDRHIPFIVVDLSAALIEGAPVVTQDIDLWIDDLSGDPLREAARAAGGYFLTGFGMQAPSFGGAGLERVDIVLTAQGLRPFEEDWRKLATIR